jgi:TorA maturation chaperone TorD
LWGSSAYAVASLYQAAGFNPGAITVSPRWGSLLPPDHIGLELAFASALHHALTHASETERTGLNEMLDAFTRRHLSSWIPDFGRRLVENARTERFIFLGRLTQDLLAA